MNKEIPNELREIFGNDLCGRFTLEQLQSSIVFILNFPDGCEQDTKTQGIPNAFSLKSLFEHIKEIFPNRRNYLTIMKYNKLEETLIGSEILRTKGNIEVLKEFESTIKERNLLVYFLNHFSFNDHITQQTLELEVSFVENKIARFYFITKNPLTEKEIGIRDKKIVQTFKGYIIIFHNLNQYNQNQIEKEESDLLYIIVDDCFMNEVVEHEVNRANSINIMADPKNQVALNLQKQHKEKIPQIKNNFETIFNSKAFPK